MQPLLYVNVNAAENVNDSREATVIYLDEIIYRHSRKIHESLTEQINSPVNISVIDFVPASPGNIYARVSWD